MVSGISAFRRKAPRTVVPTKKKASTPCHSRETSMHRRSRESLHTSSFPRKRESILPLLPWSARCRENRLTSVCVSSTIPGRRLLSFACPKESNQRKRHPRIRAARGASGSLRRTGFAHRPSIACRRNRRDPSRRPRAVHAAFPFAFAAPHRDPKQDASIQLSSSPRKRGPSAFALALKSL